MINRSTPPLVDAPAEHNPKEIHEQALAMFLSARLDATPGLLSVVCSHSTLLSCLMLACCGARFFFVCFLNLNLMTVACMIADEVVEFTLDNKR